MCRKFHTYLLGNSYKPLKLECENVHLEIRVQSNRFSIMSIKAVLTLNLIYNLFQNHLNDFISLYIYFTRGFAK